MKALICTEFKGTLNNGEIVRMQVELSEPQWQLMAYDVGVLVVQEKQICRHVMFANVWLTMNPAEFNSEWRCSEPSKLLTRLGTIRLREEFNQHLLIQPIIQNSDLGHGSSSYMCCLVCHYAEFSSEWICAEPSVDSTRSRDAGNHVFCRKSTSVYCSNVVNI